MRVCIRKSDGKILEAQSNDDASMDSLIHNVIKVRGYAESDVEFTVISDAEVTSRIEAQNEARRTYDAKRREAYDKRGATIEAMTIALFENDAAEIQRLQTIRQQVRQEIPKPAANIEVTRK